jgi:hypothetical protein
MEHMPLLPELFIAPNWLCYKDFAPDGATPHYRV